MAETKEIPVWVCPTEGCTDLFPAGDVDFQKAMTGPKVEDRAALKKSTGSPERHSRAQCPSCRARGLHIERIRTTAVVTIPDGVPLTSGQPIPE